MNDKKSSTRIATFMTNTLLKTRLYCPQIVIIKACIDRQISMFLFAIGVNAFVGLQGLQADPLDFTLHDDRSTWRLTNCKKLH
jgi:hypothetical protein